MALCPSIRMPYLWLWELWHVNITEINSMHWLVMVFVSITNLFYKRELSTAESRINKE
jgi:hypothetical protein